MLKSERFGTFYDCAEAGAILDITPRSVKQAAWRGSLQGVKVKGRWLFLRAAVLEYGARQEAKRNEAK